MIVCPKKGFTVVVVVVVVFFFFFYTIKKKKSATFTSMNKVKKRKVNSKIVPL